MSTESLQGLTNIAGFVGAGSNLIGAGASYYQGKQNASAIQSNAQAQANALAYNAREVQRETNSKELLQRRQARAALSRQSAAQAQAGVAGAGTALNVMDQSLIDAEYDALTIRASGANKADAIRYNAQNTLAAGANKAAQARASGILGAASYLGKSSAHMYGIYRDNPAQIGPKLDYDRHFRLSPYLSTYGKAKI